MTDSSIATGLGGQLLRVLKSLGADSAGQQVFTIADSAGNLLGTSGAPVPVSVSNPTTAPETGLAKDATLTASVGAAADAEATGSGTVIAILKRLRTLLNGGLPAALGTGGGVKVDGSGTALPVSAAALPLPTGAATDSQVTTSVGAQADAEATANGSVIALLKRLRTLLNAGLPAALGAGGGVKIDGSGTALPVSAAALPLPAGAVTNAQVVTSVGAQADAEATADGSVIAVLKRLRTLLNAGLPAALGAGGGLKIDGSGTSLPTTAAQGTAGAVGNAWPVKNTDGTNTAAVKAASTAAAATDAALVVSVSPNSPLPQATLTKGTQGTTGLSVQDLKDAGRTRVVIGFQAVAPATADTLLSLVKTSAGVAAAGATSIAVTAGKTLRITSVVFSLKANAAAAAFATLTLRSNPSGATVLSSESELRLDLGNTAATVGAADKVTLAIPDGMEFSGAQTIGASLAAQATTNIVSVSLIGFEY